MRCAPKNTRLLIVGDGVLRATWEALAESLGLSTAVIFAGYSSDITGFLSALDVFAMSSLTEQAPVALLEAMGCGLPVLSTAVGDIKNMVPASGSSFITPPGDLEAYQRALQALAGDAGLRGRLGAENREWCAANYEMDAMIASYRTEYLEAIRSH